MAICDECCESCPFAECILDEETPYSIAGSDSLDADIVEERTPRPHVEDIFDWVEKRWREENREKYRAYYAVHRRERIDYQKKWYQQNRQKCIDYQKERYQRKKAERIAHQREENRQRLLDGYYKLLEALSSRSV